LTTANALAYYGNYGSETFYDTGHGVSLPRVPTYAVSETPGKPSQGPAVQVGVVAVAVPPAALSN
jgi:hypothetical protein